MIPRKPFIYFLLDTPTGKAYYRDGGGTIKTLVMAAGTADVSLKHAPGNWLDTTLEFARNNTYQGINRAYSGPMELIKDVQTMVTELFMLGYGTEAALTLAVFQYNARPQSGEPQYLLYFKGPLDLSKLRNRVLENATVNIMEGGVAQLLKNYENTPIEIPCDGSILENQKINFDGLLVSDIFHYLFIPITMPSGTCILPMSFVSNEGDNFGIVRGEPGLQALTSFADIKTSSNYTFYSDKDITIDIEGEIVLASTSNPTTIQLFYFTTLTPIPGGTIPAGLLLTDTQGLSINGLVKYHFKKKISLKANEKLFFLVFDVFAQDFNLVSGFLNIKLSTAAKNTRAWAVTLYDAMKLTWQRINELASTNGLSYNYPFSSDYLQQKLNLFVTSGDALRASGDSAYQRFFSNIQTGQTLHQTFGPVIKVTMKQLYEAARVVLFGAMGTKFDGTGEALYFEKLTDIFDSSSVDFSIGEVANLEWWWDEEKGFSDVSLGYQPQTYDQKAGKYEYNTTLKMKAPVNSFEKTLELVTNVRTDSYGIEKLRSNVGNATSTTKNDSDNSVFIINTDTGASIFDFFKAEFSSDVPDPDNADNTNLHLPASVPCQPVQAPSADGEYFQPGNDNSVIVFALAGYTATEASNLTITGVANSVNKPPLAPADSVTVKLWHNGVVLYQQTTVINSVNQAIAINQNFSQLFQYKDCIYVTLESTATAEATISTASLTIGSYVSTDAANVPLEAGTFRKLLSWANVYPSSKPWVGGTSKVQYGYQYFLFNSLVPNSNFDMKVLVSGFIEGNAANCTLEVYVNGVLQAEKITIPGSVARVAFSLALSAVIQRAYTLGDVVFINATTSAASLQFTNVEIDMTSDYIKAYSLKRVQYDSLVGIPNIAKNAAGEIRSDVAGAPYNIEELTPGYLRDFVWADYFKSCLLDKVRGDLTFQTLSKNPYLSRSVGGVTITENANKSILTANRIFYPIRGKAKSNVPIRFAELMGRAINAHIHATFMGTDFYFFASKVGQKPALNESQEWEFQLSPKTNLADFLNITSFKIPDMADNSLACSRTSPVQMVPYNQPALAKYHTRNRDEFLFKDQIKQWYHRDDYGQIRQIGDIIPLQHISNGLDPVTYELYDYDTGELISGPHNLDTVATKAVPAPKVLWQKLIDTTGWERRNYQIVVKGFDMPMWKSEPQLLREEWECEDTVLLEYKHSSNTQGIVFDGATPFIGAIRFKGGFSNRFKQKYVAKTFVDQPQDIQMLNGIPYEVGKLYIGQVPDYMMLKITRALMMDGATLDGEGFTLDDGADPDEVFTKGAPMKLYSLDIRPTTAKVSHSVVAGVIDTDSSMIVSVNPQSFGPNITNSSGTTSTDLIEITVAV